MKPINKKPVKPDPRDIALSGFKTAADATPSIIEKLEKRLAAATHPPEPQLLSAMAKPGTVTIICSAPSIGKSAYLRNIALELQEQGKNAAIFLPDYTAEEFITRAICAKAGLNLHRYLNGELPRDKWKLFTGTADKLKARGLYFSDETHMNTNTIRYRARELSKALEQAGRKLDAVIIDSINYVNDEEYDVPALDGLRAMADKLKTAVICSFGLKETPSMRDGYIELTHVRAAGIAEGFTDSIYALHRPEYYDRADPTLKNKASLRRLYPCLGAGGSSQHLGYNHETQAFTVIKPMKCESEEVVFKIPPEYQEEI